MEKRTLVDAGPIVATLIATDGHHAWAREVWARLEPPVHTCEAVLSEVQHVVRRLGGNPLAVLELLRNSKRVPARRDARAPARARRAGRLKTHYARGQDKAGCRTYSCKTAAPS